MSRVLSTNDESLTYLGRQGGRTSVRACFCNASMSTRSFVGWLDPTHPTGFF